MNRVTWIRIGIVSAVVGVGSFAIWKAVSPAEPAPAAKKDQVAAETPEKKDATTPTNTNPSGAEVDPFAAAKNSFGGSRAMPASFVSETDDQQNSAAGSGAAGERYPNSASGRAAGPLANHNLLPSNDRYPSQGGASSTADDNANGNGYSSHNYGTHDYDTRYGSGGTGQNLADRFASSGAGDTGNSADAGASSTATSAGGANPLRGADAFAQDAAAAAGAGLAASSAASDPGATQQQDPFASARREPNHFGGDAANAQSQAGTQSGGGGAGVDPFDRYAKSASGDQTTNGNLGYADQPLPGQAAGNPTTTGQSGASTYDPYGRPQNSYGGSNLANQQQSGDGLGQSTVGNSAATQQEAPLSVYDRAGNGSNANANNNYNGGGYNPANSSARGSEFDPFASGGQTGGYAPTGTNGNGAVGYVDDGIGEPGDDSLEGLQSPQVSIQKSAPAEIQVGKPAIFEIVVRNNGDVMAHDVQIHEQVPRGTQLLRTSPVAQDGGRGQLVWNLGNLPPHEERVVKLELMPVAEGEIGSVATVHVAAAASVRTVATRPDLRLEVTAPPSVMIGDNVTFKIKVRNPGTGVAEGIVVTERVPPELRHEAGDLLEYEVGQIEPGGTRELELTLTAAKAGQFVNSLQAIGEAGLQTSADSRIEVLAPALRVDLVGPNKRYLERPATYTITVDNPGTAAAKDVELVAYVPQGMEFMEADNYGEYDKANRMVRWSLEELPAAQRGEVSVKLLPTEAGDHRLTAEGSAQKDLFDRVERALNVEGVAAILFEVVDVNDPIEVGAETTYEIRVLNQGSKVATNIRLEAVLPPEMSFVSGEGPTRVAAEGNRIFFDPLSKLAPRADTKYRVRAKGLKSGDLRLTVQLLANEMSAPVVKEESTRVYADQ